MRMIANSDAQRLNRQLSPVSFLTDLGRADLQVRRYVQSEGLSRVVLQHSGQVAFRGQAASAMDARLGHLLVLVCRVQVTQTVILAIKFSKKETSKSKFESISLTQ